MKRIVFKVGTSSLTHADGSLSRDKVKALTAQLAQLHAQGFEVVLVSSGAIAAGFGSLGFKKRPTKVADKQASAAVGQGLLLEEYTSHLREAGIVSAQMLLTQDDFTDQRRYKNAHQAISVLLSRHAIPIINENDSVSIAEIKVGDNDTLSAQVASMVQADLLVLLTDVDGLYTANPATHPDAKRLDRIDTLTSDLIEMAGGAGSANGTGGMLTKVKAATIATMAGVPVYICSSLKEEALIEAAHQTQDGTYFEAQAKVMKTHQQWLALYAKSQGTVTVDDGARDALLEGSNSLLVSGVSDVSGYFAAGAIVTVVDGSRRPIGKGQTQLGAAALEDLRHQKKAKGIVIHRDDWVPMTVALQLLETEF